MTLPSLLNNTSVYNRGIDFNEHMGKKWDKMDPYEKHRAISGIGKDFYGVEGIRGVRPGYERPGQERRNMQDVTDDLADAMGTDYDVREYLRYTGGDVPKTREELYNLHREMEKDHKKNSGGAYNSRSDMAGVSQRAYENSREIFKDKILNSIPKDDEQTEAAVEPVDVEPYTPSETLSDANEILEQDSFSPFGSSSAQQAASAQAQGQKNDYTLSLIAGLTGAGINTRGPGAPGTPGGFKS